MSTIYCKGICNSDKDCYGLCDLTLDPTEDATVIVLYRRLAKFDSFYSIFYEGLYCLNILRRPVRRLSKSSLLFCLFLLILALIGKKKGLFYKFVQRNLSES